MDIKNLEKKITEIKSELFNIGEMRPGSLSQQYNICGAQNCRCKDPKNPKKHGPYYQLSYSFKKKNTSQFIRPECVDNIENQLKNYRLFKKLTEEWVGLAIQHSILSMKLKKEKKS